MTIKTDESLNCPCNGIYKCAFHSPVSPKTMALFKDHSKLSKIWDEALASKPQICLPKGGEWLFIHIKRHRYLIIIGRLVISSVSGVWLKH